MESINFMHRKFFLFSFFVILGVSFLAQARPEWQVNKLREQKKQEAIQEQIDSIPLYEDKLTGDYTIVGPVRGQDIVSRKKNAIFAQVRLQAYKMKADAVMELKCTKVLKSVFQSCEGFGIRYINN